MSEPEKLATLTRPSPKRRRRWRFVLLALALIVLIAAGIYVYSLIIIDSDLQAAIAEADRLDPGWRLEELVAGQPVIPDAENNALQVVAAHALLPNPWPSRPTQSVTSSVDLRQILGALPPAEMLTPAQLADLRAALTGAERALPEARKVAGMPNGRYSPTPPVPSIFPDYYRGVETYLRVARQIADLLAFDVLDRSQKQDADGALASCRGLLNVGRSCGDLLVPIGQLEYAAIRERACRSLERALAQGEPTASALEMCQRLLEADESAQLFLKGARAHRAETYSMLDSDRSWPNDRLRRSLIGVASLGSRAMALRAQTHIVEIAKLPVEEQEQQLKEHGLPPESKWPLLARTYLLPRIQVAVKRLVDNQKSSRTELRCALAALAAERYRLAHGSWPSSLGALVPDYLSKVPIDPYDRHPLRLRRLEDGVVIYTVGLDGQDNGGKIDRVKPDTAGTDRGFRLWDGSKRRQAAKPGDEKNGE